MNAKAALRAMGRIFRRVLSGYRRVFAQAAALLGGAVLLVAAAFAVVLPLWWFATSAPAAYTTTVTAALVVALAAIAVSRLRRDWSVRRIVPILRYSLEIAGAVFLLYLAGMLYAAMQPIPAAVILLVVLLWIGLRASRRSSKPTER